MRTVKWAVMMVATLMISISCNNDGLNTDRDTDFDNNESDLRNEDRGRRVTDDNNRNDYDYEGRESDASDFVKEAASDGMMEIKMADVALEKSSNQQVKDFAQMIKNDHNTANDKLRNIASSNNTELPNNMMDKHQDKLDKLRNESGNNFDQKYIEMMVNGHRNAIDKFERARDGENVDAELKRWIANTLPTLRKHLERARELQDRM